MKKLILIFLTISIFSLVSCDDWLDVKPENEIVEEDLFSNSYGFRTAINGLYYKMGSGSLYGRELSFATVDILSRQYDIIYEVNMNTKQYADINNYDFLTPQTKSIVDNIWLDAYNVIANANNIMVNVDKKNDDFFFYGEMEKSVIKGEALAVRALMHFDILRLFAPSPVKEDAACIPYVDTYPSVRPVAELTSECIKKIINDLKEASKLTSSYDTTEMGKASYGSVKTRFTYGYEYYTAIPNSKTIHQFFQKRGFRLNYSAIKALLARVYQYAGEYDKALECAEEVMSMTFIKKDVEELIYKFNTQGIHKIPQTDDWKDVINAWETKKNLRLLDNLIFASYHPSYSESPYDIDGYFRKVLSSGSSTYNPHYFVINYEKQKTFFNVYGQDESEFDVRFCDLIFNAEYGLYPISGKWYSSETESISKNNANILPIIRLTEMYYIAAECYARAGDFVKAKQLLEKVRSERGCTIPLKVNNWEEFQTELIRDARREWISEGQLFYLYKRLDAKVDFADGNEPRKFTKIESELPIPENQSF